MLRWLSLVLACSVASRAAAGELLAPDEAVRLALARAPALDAQEASVDQARRDVATSAVDFAPRLELSASYTRLSALELPPLNFGGMEIDNVFTPILDNYQAKATLTWPVSDLFFAILPAHRARLDTLRLQEASYDVEEAKVAHTVLSAYYQLALVRAGIEVAADGVAVLEAHQRRLEDLFSVGRVTRADTLAVEAQLAEARAQYEELVGLEAVAAAHLRSLVGVDDVEVVLPDAPPFETRSEEALVALALDQRPEVRLLKELVLTQEHVAAAHRGAALPHVAVVGNLTHANPNQRVIPPTAEFYTTWDATVAVSWSPGASVKSANDAAQAKTEATKARADLESLERGLTVQVAQALAQRQSASRQASAAELQVQAAEAAFTAQQDLLEVGHATPTDALQAEASARRARHALLDAQVDQTLARIDLEYALGALVTPAMETDR